MTFGYSGIIDNIVISFDDSVIKCQPKGDHLGNMLEEESNNGISRLIDDFIGKVNNIL